MVGHESKCVFIMNDLMQGKRYYIKIRNTVSQIQGL